MFWFGSLFVLSVVGGVGYALGGWFGLVFFIWVVVGTIVTAAVRNA